MTYNLPCFAMVHALGEIFCVMRHLYGDIFSTLKYNISYKVRTETGVEVSKIKNL